MLHVKAKETKCSIFRFFFLRYLYKFNHLPQSTLVRLKTKHCWANRRAFIITEKVQQRQLYTQHTRG